MKTLLLKFTLPISMGLMLFTITLMALLSGCLKSSDTGGTSGSAGSSAHCNSGYTYNYSSQKCCPNSAPYYYPGTHGISAAGCYASCPYVGDCGSMYTKY